MSTIYGGAPLTFPQGIELLPEPASQAPGPPANLTAAISGASVTLTWNAPATGGAPTSYLLEAGTSPGLSDVTMFDTGSALTSLTATGVPPNTYFVRVRARNSAGTSSASNEVVVLVPGGPGPCVLPPGAPTTLNISVAGQILSLTWNAPTGPITSYVIEAGSASGASNIAVFATGSTATSLTAAAPPGTYYVRVRAQNACGTSGPSNEAVATVL